MGKKFNIQIRKTCAICNKPIIGVRLRIYCSKKCRERRNQIKTRDSGYSAKRQREYWQRHRENDGRLKIKCVICGKNFRQIATHTYQIHSLDGRAYKKLVGVDVKKGLIPEDYRLERSEDNFEHWDINKKNLKKGKVNWFKPGDMKAGRYERSLETLDRLKKLHTFVGSKTKTKPLKKQYGKPKK